MDQERLIPTVCRGDVSAEQFCWLIFGASQVMDDLVDEPEMVSKEQKLALFWDLLVALPRNDFYRRNRDALDGVIRAALVDWMDSTELEDSIKPEKLVGAYVLRDQISMVLIHVAELVGGYSWSREWAPHIRATVYSHESLESFMEERSLVFQRPETKDVS